MTTKEFGRNEAQKSNLSTSSPNQPAIQHKSVSSLFQLSLALILSAAFVGCTTIGPTVDVTPPAGVSASTFSAEQEACVTQTDQRLQPVANQASGANVAAALAGNITPGLNTNANIQTQYNADYSQCMSGYGATVADADSGNAPMSPISDSDRTWALFYVTPTYPAGQEAFQKELLGNIWNEEIAANAWRGPNAPPIHYGSWIGGGVGYELSVFDQSAAGVCQNYGDVSACPAKLTTLMPGNEIQPTEDAGTVCIFPKSGGVSGPSHGTRFTYDASSKTIIVETLFNGQPIPVCSRQIPVT